MAALSPAQMAILGGVNGYAAASSQQSAAGLAQMSAMGGSVASMNPWAAGMNAAAQLGVAALQDNVPMTQTAPQTLTNDNSGWSVVVGDGSSGSADSIRTPNPTAAVLAQGAAQVANNPMLLLVVVAVGLGVYLVVK